MEKGATPSVADLRSLSQRLRQHRCAWECESLTNGHGRWLRRWPRLGADCEDETICQVLDTILEEAVVSVREGPGVFLLKGIPIQKLSEVQANQLMHVVGQRFGVLGPMSDSGERVQKVHFEATGNCPDRVQRGYSSTGEIGFHNDGGDFVAFLCIRSARVGGARRAVSAVKILQLMIEQNPELAVTLFEPIMYSDYLLNDSEERSIALPMVSVSGDEVVFVVKPGYVERLLESGKSAFSNKSQKEAFEAFLTLAEDPRMSVRWDVEEGDLEIFDNLRVLHAREEYEDYSSATRARCLLRVWISDPFGAPLPHCFESASDYRFSYQVRDKVGRK